MPKPPPDNGNGPPNPDQKILNQLKLDWFAATPSTIPVGTSESVKLNWHVTEPAIPRARVISFTLEGATDSFPVGPVGSQSVQVSRLMTFSLVASLGEASRTIGEVFIRVSMFQGRTVWDSHGAVASPAMTTWTDAHGNATLVMVWCIADGTIYFASGMERDGVVAAAPLPQQSSLERPALCQFQDRIVLAYIGMDNQIRCALSFDGQQFNPSQPWVHRDSSPLSPCIGGPAIDRFGYMAWTEQINQNLHLGFTLNPPVMYEESQVLSVGGQLLQSIDTPALGAAPTNDLLLAFAGANDPANNLTVQAQLRPGDNLSPVVVYDDLCFGGPALVTTTDGFAAAYAGKSNNIYLLYGVENLDRLRIRRTKLQDTSWHAPAIATLNGITYVAWIGTNGPTVPIPTGSLNFADLGSMPVIYTNGSG